MGCAAQPEWGLNSKIGDRKGRCVNAFVTPFSQGVSRPLSFCSYITSNALRLSLEI